MSRKKVILDIINKGLSTAEMVGQVMEVLKYPADDDAIKISRRKSKPKHPLVRPTAPWKF